MTAAEFWDWFQRNEQRFRDEDDGEALEELADALSSYREGLCFEISDPEDGIRELIISAAGDRRLFAAVGELVREAPPFDHWEVAALKPPRGFAFVFETPTVHLDPRVMIFEPLSSESDPRLLGLKIYLPQRTVGDDARQAVMRVLEAGLGEQARAEIAHVEVAPLKGSPADHIPLADLPGYIEWFKARTAGN